MSNTDELEAIRLECLGMLEAHIGSLWQDVRGEWHSAFHEMPIWILLYEDSDIQACHDTLCNVLEPHMERLTPHQFTVSYTILMEKLAIFVDSFMDNDEILEARGNESLGAMPDFGKRPEASVFGNAVSQKKL